MLITFSTPVYANITMFCDIAEELLKRMGHSGSVPGAIVEEDVAAALQRLTASLSEAPEYILNSTVTTAIPIISDNTATADSAGSEPEIALKKRALPLIELLQVAANAKSEVMWK